MAQDITQVSVEDLMRLLNQNIRQSDDALDNGLDAYNRWNAWRAQFATSADAAADLVAKGDAWVTATHIDRWASAYAGFLHLSQAATGTDVTAKDVYFDWNQIFN